MAAPRFSLKFWESSTWLGSGPAITYAARHGVEHEEQWIGVHGASPPPPRPPDNMTRIIGKRGPLRSMT